MGKGGLYLSLGIKKSTDPSDFGARFTKAKISKVYYSPKAKSASLVGGPKAILKSRA